MKNLKNPDKSLILGKKHQILDKRLEKVRTRYRLARESLCLKIKPGGDEVRDVLTGTEVKDAKRLFDRFLKLQKRLGKLWYNEGTAFARHSWSIPTNPNCLDD